MCLKGSLLLDTLNERDQWLITVEKKVENDYPYFFITQSTLPNTAPKTPPTTAPIGTPRG